MSYLSIIKGVQGRKIYNSRGEEAVEVEISTLTGHGRVAAPAGKSRGANEAVDYPKGGVGGALQLLKDLVEPALVGVRADDQEGVDSTLKRLDGTANFDRIGGNTSYALSLASALASASALKLPLHQYLGGDRAPRLPLPLGNVLGGGKHGGRGAPDIQEILLLPLGARSFREAYSANIQIHKKVGALLEERLPTFARGRSDEGGWAPQLTDEEALGVVAEAAGAFSREGRVEVRLGLDVAASSFWDAKAGKYRYEGERRSLDPGEQIEYMRHLAARFSLAYLEDPLQEEDFEGFAELTRRVKGCLVVGDDLYTTNPQRLRRGVGMGAGNAVIIKPNQIGTLTETREAVKIAQDAHYTPVISHRSGETCDGHLAHLAVALGCPVIKTGIMGGERAAKLNELLRIEEALGEGARMAGLVL